MNVTARLTAGATARKMPHRMKKRATIAAMTSTTSLRAYRSGASSESKAARHVLPLHDLVVDLAQAATDHAAQEIEKLQRRVRIHRKDLVQRRAIDGQNRRIALVRFGIGGPRFVIDECHLAEEVAAIENGQRFFAHAGDELRDADAPVEDDE